MDNKKCSNWQSHMLSKLWWWLSYVSTICYLSLRSKSIQILNKPQIPYESFFLSIDRQIINKKLKRGKIARVLAERACPTNLNEWSEQNVVGSSFILLRVSELGKQSYLTSTLPTTTALRNKANRHRPLVSLELFRLCQFFLWHMLCVWIAHMIPYVKLCLHNSYVKWNSCCPIHLCLKYSYKEGISDYQPQLCWMWLCVFYSTAAYCLFLTFLVMCVGDLVVKHWKIADFVFLL